MVVGAGVIVTGLSGNPYRYRKPLLIFPANIEKRVVFGYLLNQERKRTQISANEEIKGIGKVFRTTCQMSERYRGQWHVIFTEEP